MRSQIGMVFQRFNLFPHMNVLDNVMSGPVWVKKEPPAAMQRAGSLAARTGGSGRQGEELSQPVVRRSAAAGRHRPGPGHGAQADAVRRTHLGARSRAGRRGSRRHAGSGRGRHDDDRRHPRDGVRPRGGRHPGVHGRRRRRRKRRSQGGAHFAPSTSGPSCSCRRFCNLHRRITPDRR